MVLEARGAPFPMDPHEQLWGAIGAGVGSWMNPRANTYRRLQDIPANWAPPSTSAMVFGNMGEDCATGVCFTRDPSTGENIFYGEFLVNAQGEDVVAGIRTPQPPESLRANPGEVSMGAGPAQRPTRPGPRARDARDPLPRHAGHRVHGAAEQVVHAADPQRQAHRRRQPAHRGRDGERRADRPDRGHQAGRALLARPAPASHARPESHAYPAQQGPARSPGAASGAVVFSADEAESRAAKARRSSWSASRRRPRTSTACTRPAASSPPRRHDQPRGRGGPRHGPPLRRARGGVSVDYGAQTLYASNTLVRGGDIITLDGATGRCSSAPSP